MFVVHYQEYIRGEKNIGSDQGKIAEGAQTLTEIEKIEKAILAEVEVKLHKKGKSRQENQELKQAKEELTKAEKEHEARKKTYEEEEKKYKERIISPAKDMATFSPEEQKINDDYGKAKASEESAENHRQEKLKNVREKVIENIQAELKEAELAITDLNIEFTNEET
ncbi:1846_t:CDS:2 [Entrophospora sp. SA101]|nr:1846_t:CDS:2 [Entrophospora sp. SA101]